MKATITMEEAERIMSAVKNRESITICKDEWPGEISGITYGVAAGHKTGSFTISVAGMYFALDYVRTAVISPMSCSDEMRLYVFGRGNPFFVPIEG